MAAVVNSVMPSRYGPYGNNSCTVEQIYVGGYIAGGSQYAYLLYPTEALEKKTTLPFLVFGHGATLGGNSSTKGVYANYGDLMQSVCSYGYVIAAPQSCEINLCIDFYLDMETTFATLKAKNTALSPALAIADFSTQGVFGHSMGAIATTIIADSANELALSAGAVLHGDNNSSVSASA